MFNKDLDIGSFGSDVLKLQKVLIALSFADFLPSGGFFYKTKEAVKKFQTFFGINNTGYVGPKTRAKLNEIMATNNDFLYFIALRSLGKDASPWDIAPDEFGCAESLWTILTKTFGGEAIVSTKKLDEALQKSVFYEKVLTPSRGNVIISPTGMGNGKIPNGHTGIVGENGKIMSSNSFTSLWEENYTLESWNKRYAEQGGYPVFFYRRK